MIENQLYQGIVMVSRDTILEGAYHAPIYYPADKKKAFDAVVAADETPDGELVSGNRWLDEAQDWMSILRIGIQMAADYKKANAKKVNS